MANTLIIFLILTLIIVLAVIAVLVSSKSKKKHKTDYRALFIIGISWIPLGLALKMPAFWMMGLIFMAAGLAHKDEWEKNKRSLKHLPKKERTITMIIIGLLTFFLLAGILFLLSTR
jgi:hypothetical protein